MAVDLVLLPAAVAVGIQVVVAPTEVLVQPLIQVAAVAAQNRAQAVRVFQAKAMQVERGQPMRVARVVVALVLLAAILPG